MDSFCHTVKNTRIASDLFRAISGKGAFSRFKEAIRRYSIEQAWYKYKDEAFREIAKEWCQENDIDWQE